MSNDDNIVEFTGEWQGVDTPVEMTDEEYTSAMEELLTSVNEDQLTRILAGWLWLSFRGNVLILPAKQPG